MSPPAIPPVPEKVAMIESSLGCFTWGLLSLIPVLGLPFAVRALFLYRRARSEAMGLWNPAERLLLLGAASAVFDLMLFLFWFALACRLSGLGEMFVD